MLNEDTQIFIKEFTTNLEDRQYNKLYDFVKNVNFLKSLDILLSKLDYHLINGEPVRDIILTIAEHLEPETTFFEFLEKFEENEAEFSFYLKCMTKILLKIDKPSKYMDWTCNSIIRHCTQINENDNEMIITYYEAVDQFFSTFLKCDKECKDIILKNLLKLLGPPLAQKDLTDIKFESIARKIVEKISGFKYDPMKFLNFVSTESDSIPDLIVDADYNNTALLTFYYLHYSFGNESSHVYSIEFILESFLILASDVSMPLKACDVLKFVFNRIANDTLDIDVIDSSVICRFTSAITSAMIYSDEKLIRQKSVENFNKFVNLFTSKGRYLILMNLKNCNSAGLMGHGLTIFKNFVNEALNLQTEDKMNYFTGPKMIILLKSFCYLEKKTDLVSVSDRIISSLNIIRFLIIRDKNNLSGIKDFINDLMKEYLNPMKIELEKLKTGYNYELEGMLSMKERGATIDSLELMGCPQDVPIESQISFLKNSVTQLELIESLHARVMEFAKSEK